MKLHQLRYLVAVVENGLNITAAAQRLHTSQPGVSKQLKLLEDELGFQVFMREGRALTRLTPTGAQLVERAQRILGEIKSIKRLSEDQRNEAGGSLSIGTTHTQARYVLPEVIRAFRQRYPDVQLHLHQGTSEQIATLMERDQIDFAIATGSHELFPDTTLLPLYRWHRTVAVPKGHPLTREKRLSLKALASYPIVTYSFSFAGPSSLDQVFAAAGLTPNVALTARDADVIKTYVRLGLGVGIVATVAIEPDADSDLVALDASHIFPTHTTWVGFRRGMLLRKYMYEFLQALGDHLDRRSVDRARELPTPGEIERHFAAVELPVR
ncbi:MAG: LysR substrate-binding domain-containing protein [Steroidobacteraceae bacterium]